MADEKDKEDTVYSVKGDVKITIAPQTTSTSGGSSQNDPPKKLDQITLLLIIATVFQAVIIGTFALGKSEAGTLSFEKLVEIQDEFIRILKTETNRLKNRRPSTPSSSSCTSKVYEALDQLAEQVEERVKEYVKSEGKKIISKRAPAQPASPRCPNPCCD